MLLPLILVYCIWRSNMVQAVTAGWRKNAVMRIERLNYTLKSTAIRTYAKSSQLECIHACVSREQCKAVNFKRNGGACELLPTTMDDTPDLLKYDSGWAYMEFMCQDHSRTFATFCSKNDCPDGYTCDLKCAGRGYSCKQMAIPLATTKKPTTVTPTTGKTDDDKK